MAQHRVFGTLPTYLQTPMNRRQMAAADDQLYEPEDFLPVDGQIGDPTGVTAAELARDPFITEPTAQRQAYQLSVAATSTDATGTIAAGAFYTDLVGQISTNGGLTNDHGRLFDTVWFSFNPPVNIDRWTNFQNYFWTGPGLAQVQGEFITKEAAGSQTCLHLFNGTNFVRVPASLSAVPAAGFPAGTSAGQLMEDSTDPNRKIYVWTGSQWQQAVWTPVADVPVDLASYEAGEYVYVARTGSSLNRPVLHEFTTKSGRWVARGVVVSPTVPQSPVDGMIWEDPRKDDARVFTKFSAATQTWTPVTWKVTKTTRSLGTPSDGTFYYDARDVSTEVTDGWQQNNWWRHYNDLGSADQAAYTQQNAVRPILEHWGNIESYPGNARTARHSLPRYTVYAYDQVTAQIRLVSAANFGANTVDAQGGNTAVQYAVGSGSVADVILGFPLQFSSTGQYLFNNSLDGTPITIGSTATGAVTVTNGVVSGVQITSPGSGYTSAPTISFSGTGSGAAGVAVISGGQVVGVAMTAGGSGYTPGRTSATFSPGGAPLVGYRFFRDFSTGLVHSSWTKSDVDLRSTEDANGIWRIPLNLSNNPDHSLVTQYSRSTVLQHYQSIIAATSVGAPLGLNNRRWGRMDANSGATVIDSEGSLLRALALLQKPNLDMPEAVRTMGQEYGRTVRKFANRLTQKWNAGMLSGPDGVLTVTVTQAVDAVLSDIFVGRNADFPFWSADMGTYLDTNEDAVKPILIPPSSVRTGATPAFVPALFTDEDGNRVLRGHDGSLTRAFGDARDQVLLNLEQRFFARVPTTRTTESTDQSARRLKSSFHLADFYGNWVFQTTVADIDSVTSDFTAINSPVQGQRVYDRTRGVYATFSSGSWTTSQALPDDVFRVLNRVFTNQVVGFDGSLPLVRPVVAVGVTQYFVFNGSQAAPINTYDRAGTFDYSLNEYLSIVHREFERWAVLRGLDTNKNTLFVAGNPFTFNYSSAGIEGNWKGIYRRVYGTVRPHSAPWEILGYTLEPTWWRSVYVPTFTAPDGTPRYARSHPMWADLSSGSRLPRQELSALAGGVPVFFQTDVDVSAGQLLSPNAPVPVDSSGTLIDPITAGIVAIDSLDQTRIADPWQFGDEGPVEDLFLRSPEYAFAVALAGYLMKPARWVEMLWSDTAIPVGSSPIGPQLFRGPFLVSSKTLTRAKIAEVAFHGEVDSSGDLVSNPGVQAWISEVLRSGGADPTTQFANVLRATSPTLGWRASGFLNPQKTLINTLAGVHVPTEDVFLLVHQSTPQSVMFHSGVTFVKDVVGYRVYGFDRFDPFFSTDVPAKPVTGGQTQSTEVITATQAQTSFTVTTFTIPGQSSGTRFAVLVNGLKVPDQYVQVANFTTFNLVGFTPINAGDQVTAVVTSPSGSLTTPARQFVIDNVAFTYYTTGTGTTLRVPYGHLFQSSQSVVEFLVNYGRWLGLQGWTYDQVDEGGSNLVRDWLFVAQRFAAWSLTPRRPGEFLTDIPSPTTVDLTVDFGNLMQVDRVFNGSYSVLDQNGVPLKPESLFVSRVEDEITVSSRERLRGVYGLRVHINEIEHAVFISNVTRFGDLMYDPVTGLRQNRLDVKTYRTAEWNGRLETPGYVVSGSNLLPNFDKVAKDFTRYYDMSNPVDDPTKRDQARNLYGFFEKSYTRNLEISDVSAFAFHVGSLPARGTRRPFQAFSRATVTGTDGVEVSENWAWRAGAYGGLNALQTVQFLVFEHEQLDDIQVIKFQAPPVPATNDRIIYIGPVDRTVLPVTDPRWIKPPRLPNITFSLNPDGTPVTTDYYHLDLVDSVTGEEFDDFFHWDPAIGIHEPQAYALVDFELPVDPARYTDGPLAANTGRAEPWGAPQVGRIWWDTSLRAYRPYRRETAGPTNQVQALVGGFCMFGQSGIDPHSVADNWGHVADVVVSSVTLSGINVSVTTATPHGLAVNESFDISGADQPLYNGTFQVATVTDAFNFTWQFFNGETPGSPATGAIFVTTRDIAVYEWVQSNVHPDNWAQLVTQSASQPDSDFDYKPSGAVLNIGNESWVTVKDPTTGVATYYFWIRGATTTRPGRDFSLSQVESRLRDPTGNGLAWFAPTDATTMVLFTAGTKFSDGDALELAVNDLTKDEHVEWILVPEASQFRTLDERVVSKLLDSIAGIDSSGNQVPRPQLLGLEMFGTEEHQTVFSDRADAVNTLIAVTNRVLAASNMGERVDFTTVFSTATESPTHANGFWQQADYRVPYFQGIEFNIVVAQISDRDSLRNMAVGDYVKVTNAGHDPFDAVTPIAGYFMWDGSAWQEVGFDDATAQINPNVVADPVQFHTFMNALFNDLLTTRELNDVVFALLYEMLDQHQQCPWMFKTSFLDLTYETSIAQPSVQPIDELASLVDAVNDLKPFHTKLHEVTKTVANALENASVAIDEIVDQRITMVYDRLSCNAFDDFAWDTTPWDSDAWDITPWFFSNLGQDDFTFEFDFVASRNENTYTVPGISPQREVIVEAFSGPTQIAVTPFVLDRMADGLVIQFTSFPVDGVVYKVFASRGTYFGSQPVLPPNLLSFYPDMVPYPSSYEHAYARSSVDPEGALISDASTYLAGCGCDTNDGGDLKLVGANGHDGTGQIPTITQPGPGPILEGFDGVLPVYLPGSGTPFVPSYFGVSIDGGPFSPNSLRPLTGDSVYSFLSTGFGTSDTAVHVVNGLGFVVSHTSFLTLFAPGRTNDTLSLLNTVPGTINIYLQDVQVTSVQARPTGTSAYTTLSAAQDYTVTYGGQSTDVQLTSQATGIDYLFNYTHRPTERVIVTGISGNTLTVSRIASGTVLANDLYQSIGLLSPQVTSSTAPTAVMTFLLGSPSGSKYAIAPNIGYPLAWTPGTLVQQVANNVPSGQSGTIYDPGYINKPGFRGSTSDPSGGNSEERVVLTPTDRCSLQVTTSYTDAYAAWDATPWDSAVWDSAIVTNSDYVTNVAVNQDLPKVDTFSEVLPTSEDFVIATTDQVVAATSTRTEVIGCAVNYGSGLVNKVLGADFTVFDKSEVVFNPIPPQILFGDGVSTSFTLPVGSGGIGQVFLDSTLLMPGIDYNINPTNAQDDDLKVMGLPGESTYSIIPSVFGPDDDLKVMGLPGESQFAIAQTGVSLSTIVLAVPPTLNQAITIIPNPHIFPGVTVRLRYGVFVALSDRFLVSEWPVGSLLDWDGARTVTFEAPPPDNDRVVIAYRAPLLLPGERRSDYSSHGYEVDEVLPDHLMYDVGKGFDNTRQDGTLVLNSKQMVVYRFSNGAWTNDSTVPQNTIVWDRRNLRSWAFVGTDWRKEYSAGDQTEKSPALRCPQSGAGFTSGAYTLGQIDGSFSEFKAAWQIRHAPSPYPMDYVSLWLAADHGFRVMNGTDVSQWNDISTWDQHPTQPSASRQPLYNGGFFNAQPAVVFNHTNETAMTTPVHTHIDNVWDTGGYLVAIVEPTGFGDQNNGCVIEKQSGWSLSVVQHSVPGTAMAYDGGMPVIDAEDVVLAEFQLRVPFTGGVAVWQTAGVSGALGATFIVEVLYNSTGPSHIAPVFRVNGVVVKCVTVTAPSGTRTSDSGTPLTIGDVAAANRGFDGGIFELVLFNNLPSVLDINSFVSYLGQKWFHQLINFNILVDNFGDLLADEFGNLIIAEEQG